MEQSAQASDALQTGASLRRGEHDSHVDRATVPDVQNRMDATGLRGETRGTTKSLISKLAEVMGEVHRVPKRGRNEHFKYDYAMEADITDAVRALLAARHVMLIPSVDSVTKEGKLTTTLMTFTFHDGESQEKITLKWAGCGEDGSDKGLPKSLTAAIKYVLAKTFLIATGDDPEATDGQGKSAARQQQRAPDPTPKDDTRHITAEQVKAVKGLMRTHNTNVDEFKVWVERRFKVTESKNIQRKDYAAICAYISEGVDITTGESK